MGVSASNADPDRTLLADQPEEKGTDEQIEVVQA